MAHNSKFAFVAIDTADIGTRMKAADKNIVKKVQSEVRRTKKLRCQECKRKV